MKEKKTSLLHIPNKLINKRNIYSPHIKINTSTNLRNESNFSNNKRELKQFIDMTVTHFTIKCAFLCNQIETMKKEFIEQLENLNNKFLSSEKRFYYSNKKTYPKLILDTFDNDNFNYSNNKNNCYNTTNNFTIENDKKNMSLTFIETNKTHKNLNEFSSKKSNKTVKSVIELDEMVKNPELEKENFKKKKSSSKKIIKIDLNEDQYSRKELAINQLIKSKILTLEEKLKLRFTTRKIYNQFSNKKILTNEKKIYQQKIKSLENNLINEEASITSSSQLSFINKINEKDTLCNERRKNNIKFLTAIAILKDINSEGIKQAESIYKLILKESKFDCIKSLFISYLKYLNRNTENKKYQVLKQFINYINKNKELIDQSEMLRENSYMISLYSFGLKEIYNVYEQEIKKREKKKEYKEIINKINSIETNLIYE